MFGKKKNVVLIWMFVIALPIALSSNRATASETEFETGSGDQAWGTIEGRFLFDGQPLAPKVIKPLRDTKAFDRIIDESLLVDPKSRGIANVLIFLVSQKGQEIAVHPSYKDTANSKVSLTTKNGRFEPHILLMRTSQTLLRKNADSVAHSASIQTFKNSPSGILVPLNSELELRYPAEERLPLPVRCNIHPWMSGFVLLRDSPYMAKSNSKGEFELRHLPVGQHEFRLWHEKAGYLKNVSLGSVCLGTVETENRSATDKKGLVKIDLVEGSNDFGETKLAPSLFERTD